jgi:hypothetical protein
LGEFIVSSFAIVLKSFFPRYCSTKNINGRYT